MAQVTEAEFIKKFNSFFPNGAMIVAEKDIFSALALLGKVYDDEDELEVTLFVDPLRDIRFRVQKIEEFGDEWMVTTAKQRWAWRKPDEAQAVRFKKQMEDFDA